MAYNEGASSGNLVLIESQTASNVASVNFTAGISGYSIYYLYYYNVSSGNNNDSLQMLLSIDGGSSYINTGYDNAGVYAWTGNVSSANRSSTGIVLTNSQDAFTLGSGYTTLFNPSNAIERQSITSMVNRFTGFVISTNYSTISPTTSEANAIQINYDSGGNVVTGTFKLYGVQN